MVKPYCNPEIWGGIECTINRVGDNFFDQLDYAGHYRREEDISAIASLGIKKIRYPVLWEKHQPDKNKEIDWSWIGGQLQQLKANNLEVIAGLLHHGSGPAFTSLSDNLFPELFASYAGKVARQFPWINYYTPINEPLTTARFSGLYGLWYPHHKDTGSFVRMLLNELKAIVLGMKEIRKINPAAILVQTEDLGKTYSTAALKYQAEFENERRWLTYDILSGKMDKEHRLWRYFRSHGIAETELEFFINHPCVPDIFGFNHYLTSERYLDERIDNYPLHLIGGNGKHKYADVEAVRVQVPEETGIEMLLKEAWQRYKRPLAITEVHLHCHREEQLRWFSYVSNIARKLSSLHINIKAVTSWAILGSYGWNCLLTQPKGEYEPGVFDIRSGSPRSTALAGYIKDMKDGSCESHLLAQEEGWWQRSSRYIYSNKIIHHKVHKLKNTAPVLIIGKNGTLGSAFARICEERSISYQAFSRKDCDISRPEEVNSLINTFKPWAVINASGYVKVDDAEKEKLYCFRDNIKGPVNLAIACNKLNIQLVSFSSDLVFDGEKRSPYLESDLPNPLNVYGKSKFNAEELLLNILPSALMIRTSAFFGPWDEYNFVHYVCKMLLQSEPIIAAEDIYVSPTYVPDLVNTVLDILIDREDGIWHLANQGEITWFELAYKIATSLGLDSSLITPLPASELKYKAKRPGYSVLGTEKGHLLPSLENALDRYAQRERLNKRRVA